VAVYFGALGLGYLLLEMAFIQRLQLWLGHPVYAVAATLAGFLVLSGAGSLWVQDRWLPRSWWAPAFIAVMVPFYVWVFWTAGSEPASLSFVARTGAVALLVLPLATVMGMPFPLGLRHLARARAPDAASGDGASGRRRLGAPGTGVAWAWAVNGFASVIAAPLAVLGSMEAGFFWVLLAGAACYGVAAAALASAERRGSR
jgi:hypothetical protein